MSNNEDMSRVSSFKFWLSQLYCSALSAVPPRIVGQQEEEMSTLEGHMVSLTCDVQTHLTSEIIWTKDGQLLLFASGVQILSGNMQDHLHRDVYIYST